ncbi:hypothetical protein F5146DRAFT_891814, partial [Armillaria mellea]
FHPENLFFRTIDTGRLLPMALASFRVQLYVTKDLWDAFQRDKEKEKWTTYVILALIRLFYFLIMHILIFRNMHDFGGGYIPIICIDWTREFVDMAMDYWVDLNVNRWTKEECEYRCAQSACSVSISGSSLTLVCEIARNSHGLKPSFYELGLCIRALLLEENVGYVPPFIMLFENVKDGKARTLFTRASHVLSLCILDSLPKTCGNT